MTQLPRARRPARRNLGDRTLAVLAVVSAVLFGWGLGEFLRSARS